jgi:hypothetical protein
MIVIDVGSRRQDTTGALLVLDQLRGPGSDSEIIFQKFLLHVHLFLETSVLLL